VLSGRGLLADLARRNVRLVLTSAGTLQVDGPVSVLDGALKAAITAAKPELVAAMRSTVLEDAADIEADATPTRGDWERYWTAYPEERPAPPAPTPPPPARGSVGLAYSSSIGRPPRYRLDGARGQDRVCCACGDRRGPEGPLPSVWDVHLVGGEMVLSCSPACRAERGLVERKPVPTVGEFLDTRARSERSADHD
jgi:hypothetical protein